MCFVMHFARLVSQISGFVEPIHSSSCSSCEILACKKPVSKWRGGEILHINPIPCACEK
jgi:hypothetical protein